VRHIRNRSYYNYSGMRNDKQPLEIWLKQQSEYPYLDARIEGRRHQ